jgi:hypothetical protein
MDGDVSSQSSSMSSSEKVLHWLYFCIKRRTSIAVSSPFLTLFDMPMFSASKSRSVSDASSSTSSLKNAVNKGAKSILRPFKKLRSSSSAHSRLSSPSCSSLALIPDDDEVIDVDNVDNDDDSSGQMANDSPGHRDDKKSVNWEKELGMYTL